MSAARRAILFDSPPDRRVLLGWDLPGTLRAAAILTAVEAAFVAVLLAYRLGVQFMAWADMGAPWSWIYWFAGLFSSPFSGLETVKTPQAGHMLEFSTMVALETYLVAGLVLVTLFGGLSLLAARHARRSWAWTVDTAPAFDAWHSLEPSLTAVAEEAEYRGGRGLSALRARLAAVDWMRWPTARRLGS